MTGQNVDRALTAGGLILAGVVVYAGFVAVDYVRRAIDGARDMMGEADPDDLYQTGDPGMGFHRQGNVTDELHRYGRL